MISPANRAESPPNPRILLFSQRNIFGKALFRCPHFEFENMICTMDSAEILAPAFVPRTSRHEFFKRIAFNAPVILNPGLKTTKLNKDYDLFFAVCGAPEDLMMVNTVQNWKDRCKTSICLIDEIWVKQMSAKRNFLQILRRFDHVLLYYSQSVAPLSEQVERKCTYLPPGVDSLAFCPHPKYPARVIDVYSIGRRSAVTHNVLLQMAANDGLFYLYDTFAGDQCITSSEHRALFINLAKRSRFFIVNPGLIDRPETRGNQIEIGNRYFEGTAAGMILIGVTPENAEFGRLFNWPDSVIQFPYDGRNIDAFLRDLDDQPVRLEKARQTNVIEALRRHDWAYRWEAILAIAALKPMDSLYRRKESLAQLADNIRPASQPPP